VHVLNVCMNELFLCVYVTNQSRSTHPCICTGLLNRVPALIGWGRVKVGMSPVLDGRYHCLIPYGT